MGRQMGLWVLAGPGVLLSLHYAPDEGLDADSRNSLTLLWDGNDT